MTRMRVTHQFDTNIHTYIHTHLSFGPYILLLLRLQQNLNPSSTSARTRKCMDFWKVYGYIEKDGLDYDLVAISFLESV